MSLLYPDSTHMQTLLDAVNKRRVVLGSNEWKMPPPPSRAHMIAIRDWLKAEIPTNGSGRWIDMDAVDTGGGFVNYLNTNHALPRLAWNQALFNRLEIGRDASGTPRLTAEQDNGVYTRWHLHNAYAELYAIVREMLACVMMKAAESRTKFFGGNLPSGFDDWQPSWNAAKNDALANTGQRATSLSVVYASGAYNTEYETFLADFELLKDFKVGPEEKEWELISGSEWFTQERCLAKAIKYGDRFNKQNLLGVSATENQWQSNSLDENAQFQFGTDAVAPSEWPTEEEVISKGGDPDPLDYEDYIVGADLEYLLTAEFDFADPASTLGAP